MKLVITGFNNPTPLSIKEILDKHRINSSVTFIECGNCSDDLIKRAELIYSLLNTFDDKTIVLSKDVLAIDIPPTIERVKSLLDTNDYIPILDVTTVTTKKRRTHIKHKLPVASSKYGRLGLSDKNRH